MNDPVKEPNFVKLFISSECSYHHPPLNTRRCLLAKVDKPVADEAKMKLIWSLSTSFIVRRSAQELITPYVWTLTLQADYVSPLTW